MWFLDSVQQPLAYNREAFSLFWGASAHHSCWELPHLCCSHNLSKILFVINLQHSRSLELTWMQCSEIHDFLEWSSCIVPMTLEVWPFFVIDTSWMKQIRRRYNLAWHTLARWSLVLYQTKNTCQGSSLFTVSFYVCSFLFIPSWQWNISKEGINKDDNLEFEKLNRYSIS